MVRLKNRYLLVDILYPDPSTWPGITPKSASKLDSSSAQLAIHAPTSDALTPGLLARMVREEVGELYGDWGVGKLGGASAGGINVKYLSPATSTAIIRCPRASFRLVWSALTYMSHVPDNSDRGPSGGSSAQKRAGRPCVFRVVRVSGTMRKAEEEAIRRARSEIVRVRGAQEKGVLGDLVGDPLGLGGSSVEARAPVPAMNPVVDESSEDEGMAVD
ncbi:RNA-binding protein pop5 [Penicillium alfredii]|uniref:Ribonuclease P/MRP protein subunit POP5 n=1 Tax=Penicillium alfredii TaxID=1506179 RepID=A0A9W9FLE2_9EURO|nr:RNA-binding protein pop5 [Penicillium alfredii]KAJ5102289.1 RNA-binding protein pop5 [Penicillium alfredii]